MSVRRLRLVFFGTPELAVPTLTRLVADPHDVVGVVTQPDRGRGRGRKRSPSPVGEVALREEIPLVRAERISAPEAEKALRALAPDLGVVVAFGQFLPKRIRELPSLGFLINAHASLLPRHRGAAPIAHAILAGDTRTGISVMRIEREMDAGAVALVRELEIGPDETTGQLEERLGALAADAIAEAVEQISAGCVRWCEQDHAAATPAPKLGRDDARIDWRQPSDAILRRVRAMAPRPGAATQLEGEPLRVLAARALEPAGRGPCAPPGTVRVDDDGSIRVATGDGAIALLRVQRAGARELDADAFLRGRPIAAGTVLA